MIHGFRLLSYIRRLGMAVYMMSLWHYALEFYERHGEDWFSTLNSGSRFIQCLRVLTVLVYNQLFCLLVTEGFVLLMGHFS